MDIIKSTLLWRHYEEEMKDIFCVQWKCIYDWVCELRVFFSVTIIGQYGDEWYIKIENIDNDCLQSYISSLRESMRDIDRKYFTSCTYRIAYGETLKTIQYPV
jgi:hypothetical protein